MEFRLLFGAGADRIRPEPESAPRDIGLPEPEPPRKVVAPQHTATEHYNYNGSFESVGASVSDPYSLNPDPAKNLKPDPSYFLSLFIVYLFCDDLTVKIFFGSWIRIQKTPESGSGSETLVGALFELD